MKMKYTILIISLLYAAFVYSQNGKIIEKEVYNLLESENLKASLAKIEKEQKSRPDVGYIKELNIEKIFYESDGLKVRAYMLYPKKEGKYPVIIYNRGGNRDFGAINDFKMAFILARIASWGYVVVASQYRGNDGGEGMEEFGGKDVNDVLNLILLAENLEFSNGKIGMYGWSRGGMMTLLSLMKTEQIKAAAIGGAASDLRLMNDSRGGEMEKYVYAELIPDYWEHKDSLLDARSAITQVDKICKTTPILIMHGTADWRVIPEESLNLANAFQKEKNPYRLVMFEGGDHGLTEFRSEVDEIVKKWFDKYLKDGIKLPNLEPHGR